MAGDSEYVSAPVATDKEHVIHVWSAWSKQLAAVMQGAPARPFSCAFEQAAGRSHAGRLGAHAGSGSFQAHQRLIRKAAGRSHAGCACQALFVCV